MRRSSAIEDEAFLQGEARELAVLAEECTGGPVKNRLSASVLHTLAVELSVLVGLGDEARMEWLAAEAIRLLSAQGKHEAVSAFQATLSRLRRISILPPASPPLQVMEMR